MPELEDLRSALVALHQKPALMVGAEVHRADHSVATALPQPALSSLQQRLGDFAILFGFEESEHAPLVGMELVEAAVDMCADAPHRPAVPPRQEVLRLRVL